MNEADRAARILAVEEMKSLADQIRVMKKKDKLTHAVANRIQKMELKRTALRDTYMKLVWNNSSPLTPDTSTPVA